MLKNIRDDIKWLRPAFLLAVAMLCAVPAITTAQQQGYPGTWKKVIAYGVDIDFCDSLNGVASAFITTRDGGKTWKTAASLSGPSWFTPFIEPLSCTAPGRAIEAKPNCDVLELDNDSIFQSYCAEYVLPDYETYTPFAQKMYDTSYGFRFVQATATTSKTILNFAYIAVTHDDWRSYQCYGDTLSGSELTSRNGGGISSQITGAMMVDSNEVWLGFPNMIYHTTNAGVSWATIYPLSGTPYASLNPGYANFTANPSTKEVYAVCGATPIDFVYSSDYGKSWQIDSAFRGRMVRLSVPAPDTLWALLCGASVGVPNDVGSLVEDGYTNRKFFVRTLSYSSNNGASWFVDSTTFAVDTAMTEMYWHDARHGWISAIIPLYPPYTDTLTPHSFIWYYDADGTAGVQKLITFIKYATFPVYPDPATTTLYTYDNWEPSIQIFDPLGRTFPVRILGNALDVSALPVGIYYLYDGITVRAKFVKE